MTLESNKHNDTKCSNLNYKKLFISITAILVIAIIIFTIYKPNFQKNQEFKPKLSKDTTIYITSDVHNFSDELTDKKEAYQKYISSGNGKQIEYIGEIIDAFVYDIKRKKPDVLIISGDLTNNGEKASHLELAKKLETIEKSGTNVYVIPGNHDISNPWARELRNDKQYVADTIDENEFSKLYASFGFDEAISRDDKTLSYLVTPTTDVWFLMLDTNKYKNNMNLGIPETDGILAKSTLEWISRCCDMANEKGAKIVTVMHHNILDHSEVIQEGYTLNNSSQLLGLLKENQVNLVFSGHIHVQDISSNQKSGKSLYDVASGALSVYPHQYGVLTFSENNKANYTTNKVDVESWAKSENIKDENLRNFNQYSQEYFTNFSNKKTTERLLIETDYSEDELNAMIDVMKILNIRYFSGTENLNSDILGSEGYKLWTKTPDSFLRRYIFSIINDNDIDDNNLNIKLNPVSKN
jgi:3',5'-cyclic AMP phosphodiesterase CpdA